MTRPGDTLLKGRYRTTRLLHRGGFGFIYLAWDKVLGQNVVLKELIPALAGDPATLKHFIREAQATSCLAHPNIVRTLNLFTDQDNYFIVMEYLPVGSLEDLLHERERLTLDEAVLIATDICTALTEAHSYGVYHCDLKPSNILFDKNGVAKLADFGAAYISDALVARSCHEADDLSSGTLFYLSPEQLDGIRNDPRVDVYALGVVLYQMLSGQSYLPFDQRDTPNAWTNNVCFIRHRRPRPLNDLPAEVNMVLMKALSKRPARRFKSAAALRSALVQASVSHITSPRAMMALSPLGAGDSRPSGLLAHRHPPRDWVWVATAVMAVSLFFLLLASLFLGRAAGW